MKKMNLLVSGILAAALCVNAQARDTELKLPIKAILDNPDFQGKLDKNIALFFGDAAPEAEQNFGEFVSNKKTNAFGKDDDVACRWAALSALIHLQERARSLGGNAVINIKSYYKKNTFSSETEYECHAGGVMAGVALKGNVVKFKSPL